MVGLKDFGEAAWSIEQVLNLWLRQEQEVTPILLDLLEQAYRVFLAWVEHLKTRRGHAPDVTSMVALANSLRDGSETGVLLPLPGEAAAAAPSESLAEAAPAAFQRKPARRPSAAVPSLYRKPAHSFRSLRHWPRSSTKKPGAHLATLQREFASLWKQTWPPRQRTKCTGLRIPLPASPEPSALHRSRSWRTHSKWRCCAAITPHIPTASKRLPAIQQAIAALTLMLSDVVRQHEPEAAPTLVEMLDTLYPELVVEKPEAAGSDSEPQSALPERVAAAAAPGASPTSTAVEAPQLHDELDEQLLPLFLEEALDLNQNIATQLHAWRSNPSDGEAVRRLARLFHTLKGSARMAGAMNLGELTHAIETRMQEAQEASSAPLQLIDDIDNAFDVIVQIVERLQHGESADAHRRDIRRRRHRNWLPNTPQDQPVPGFRTGCCRQPAGSRQRSGRTSGPPCGCVPT
jgi:chemosensory pili system protein ChpA (sensor histidine kinase/response regulator)